MLQVRKRDRIEKYPMAIAELNISKEYWMTRSKLEEFPYSTIQIQIFKCMLAAGRQRSQLSRLLHPRIELKNVIIHLTRHSLAGV